MQKLYVCMETDSKTTLIGVLSAIYRGTTYIGINPNSKKTECSGSYKLDFKLGGNKLNEEIEKKYFGEFTKWADNDLYDWSYFTHTGTYDNALNDFLYLFLPKPDDPELETLLKSVENEKYKEWELLKLCGQKHDLFRLYEKLPEGTLIHEKIEESPSVKFKSRIIEEKVRKARCIDDSEITAEDLEYYINSIAIIDQKSDDFDFYGSAPWESTGTCFNMRYPNLEFNESELPENIDDWRDDMNNMTIETCYFGAPVSLDYLLAFPNLTELYLGGSHNIQDWSFIEKLPKLKMVGLCSSGNGDNAVKHLAKLKDLDNLIIWEMGVTDLTPFEGKRFSELNLCDNKIKNAKPFTRINPYYLKLANNLIEEADDIKAEYLLDLSNNKLKSVERLLENGVISK